MVEGQLRRYDLFLAQVGFLVGDLRRKMGSYALHWRRSSPFFLTCANIPLHLRQKYRHLHRDPAAPAPKTSAPAPILPYTCTNNIGTCAKIPIHLHHVVGKVNRNYWTMSE